MLSLFVFTTLEDSWEYQEWSSNSAFAQEEPHRYYTVICPDYTDGVLQNLRDLITVIWSLKSSIQ